MSALLASALDRWLERWRVPAQGFAAIRAAWLERAHSPGELLTVNAGDGRVSGRFAGLDADGSLLLTDGSGALRRFTFGDVALGAPSV
jgi:BirA family biotin operon repressor/biotin-[acetyl-CoA-carboxylase] ligase